ncbi:MAG TPA: hypothetical protein V6C72_06450, partial [Chroococcales cyanobacterium]
MYFYLSGRRKHADASASQDRTSVLLLTEKMKARDEELTGAHSLLQVRDSELASLRSDSAATRAELAAAMERNLRLHDLQAIVDQRDAQLSLARERIL